MSSLYKKLLDIQKAVDSFTKDKKGLNYEYVKGDQVLDKIRPLMNDKGLLLKQEILSVKNERMDYITNSGKDKSEILSSVAQRFTWIDTETDEKDENLFHGNGMNDWDKGLGSALTYAERYFLLKFFHVPTDGDDPDARQEGNAGKSSNNDLKWLNKTKYKTDEITKDWINVTESLRAGKCDLEYVKSKFRLNQETEKELNSIASKSPD